MAAAIEECTQAGGETAILNALRHTGHKTAPCVTETMVDETCSATGAAIAMVKGTRPDLAGNNE